MPIRLRRNDEVGDGAAVVRGVDHGRRLGREAGEVLAGVEPADVDVGGQEGLQRDRRRHLAGANEVGGDLINLLVQRLDEMRRLEKIGDPVERLVVDQDGAKQRLLGLDVVRRDAILRGGDVRRACGRSNRAGAMICDRRSRMCQKSGTRCERSNSRNSTLHRGTLGNGALQQRCWRRTYDVAPRGKGGARCLALSAIPTVQAVNAVQPP